jgi:hypothetical protein
MNLCIILYSKYIMTHKTNREFEFINLCVILYCEYIMTHKNNLLKKFPRKKNCVSKCKTVGVQYTVGNECQDVISHLKGLQMGSSLAPLISNIFVGFLEREVVKKLIKTGSVISWTRYADDCVAIIKKRGL